MTALYAAVFLRAASDVVLYAYLPLYLHHLFGDGHFTLIAVFLAVPAGIRAVTAPFWGRLAGRSSGSALKVYLLLPLIGYAVALYYLPRMVHPGTGLAVLAVASLVTAGFNPVSRTWLAPGRHGQGFGRLALWYQWEGIGYFVSGLLFGWAIYVDIALWVNAATALSLLTATSMMLMAFTLPKNPRLTLDISPASPLPSQGVGASGSHRWRRLPGSVIAFHFIAFFFWEAVAGTFSLRWVEQLHGTPTALGVSISIATLVAAGSYRPLSRWGSKLHGAGRSAAPLFFSAVVGYALMYVAMLSTSLLVAGVAYLIPMSGVLRTGTNMLLTLEMAEKDRGKSIGIVEALESSAAVMGFLMGGISADVFGLNFPPFAALLGCAPLILLAFIVHRQLKR